MRLWMAVVFTAVFGMTNAFAAQWYGYALYTSNGADWQNHFVSFNMQEPNAVQAVSETFPTVWAATYLDGDVWFVTQTRSLCKAPFDAETQTIGDYEMVVPALEQYNMYIDMAYNPVDGMMYYLCQDSQYNSYLKRSNLTIPSEVEVVGNFSVRLWTLAINGEGQAYGVAYEGGNLYEINLNDATTTLVGPTGKEVWYTQSMAFDLETGELYWAQFATTADQGFYQVDTETGAATSLGEIGQGTQLAGLFMVPQPTPAANYLLTSHWTQDYPYNQLCPRDPVMGNAYSYAGCPAIAMGQIINYLRTTQGTRFDDNDDYAHNYAGRNYKIDDDWETLKFPSFPQLNVLLDSVDATFQRGEELSDYLAAAVVFACGTACTQVYTSEGSGTFYVDQAYEAYQRFGFTDCVLFREASDEMYTILISNLQAGYPAHLAVENPAGTVGHNVVVDGYRESDGKFHINFGYGGTLDNWYDIPDPNFYYGMTKIEGIILNIIPTFDAVHETASQQSFEVYPNPVSDVLYMRNLPCETVNYSIFNVLGQKVSEGISNGTISVAELGKGLYIMQVKGEKFLETAKFIVK